MGLGHFGGVEILRENIFSFLAPQARYTGDAKILINFLRVHILCYLKCQTDQSEAREPNGGKNNCTPNNQS